MINVSTREGRAELRRLAEAATPGPWRVDVEGGGLESTAVTEVEPGEFGAVLDRYPKPIRWHSSFDQPTDDAAFIEALSPATVLALLDLVDALGGNAEVQRLQEGAYTVYPPFVQVAPDGSMLLRVPEVSGVGAPRVIANLRDALNAVLLDTTPDPGADG